MTWLLSPVSVTLIGVAVGTSLFVAPSVAWAALAALLGLLALTAPSYAWVIAAVAAAGLSRILVSTGLFPSLLNFFHFPLVLGAVVSASLSRERGLAMGRSLAVGSVALLSVSFVSSLLNDGELMRPIFAWLVFCEPFLLVYAVVRMPPPPNRTHLLWAMVLFLAIAQLPLGLWQSITVGWADHVQGTFVGMGAGHHVAGAVALVGALVCVARALSAERKARPAMWIALGVLLFLVPIASDAKQTVVAFIPALLLLPLAMNRARLVRSVGTLSVAAPLVAGAFFYYEPLRVALDWDVTRDGVRGKVDTFDVIVHRGFEDPVHWLVGAGPGNTVSRVALMGLDGYLQSDSPVARLGLRPAPLAQEISDVTTSNWRSASSSAWSGISSWLGLFGDFGILGVLAYSWMCWKLWRAHARRGTWRAATARAALVMSAFLGAIYSWLEEPGFTLVVALVVAAALVDASRVRARGASAG